MKKLIAAMVTMTPLLAAASEWSIFQPVTLIQQNTSGHVYFVGTNKWGAASCATATYAWVKADAVARKEILAIILAAQAMGKPVRFAGNCDVPDYFVVTDVMVQD